MTDAKLPPIGKNTLSNPSLFEQRKLYKNKSFPYGNGRFVPIDMLYEKPFYGKVDIYGVPVYPSESYMKQLPSDGLLTALNFVVDAFLDMKAFMDFNTNKTNLGDLFPVFVPRGTTQNFHDLYHNHFTQVIFETFINDYLTYDRSKNKIQTFTDFTEEFIKYVSLMVQQFPISKTNFLTSYYCPNNISGLVVELQTDDFGNDGFIYEKYLSHPAFEKYVSVAASFGFYVDKNAPWRLVANLDSPIMTQYMSAYGIKLENNSLFSNFFYKVDYFDYESIKRYIYNMYRVFLIDNRKYYEHHIKNCVLVTWQSSIDNQYSTSKKYFSREIVPPTYEEFLNLYGDDFFLEIYFKIRMLESGQKITGNKFKKELKKILTFLKPFGVKGSVSHISTLTKQTKIYYKPRVNQSAPYKIKYFGEKTISGLYAYTLYGNMDSKGGTGGVSATKTDTSY